MLDSPVTLAELKAHCRVEGSQDDDVLTALNQAAAEHYQIATNWPDVDEDTFREIDKHGIKMLAAHWFENRETTIVGGIQQVPFAYESIVNIRKVRPFR